MISMPSEVRFRISFETRMATLPGTAVPPLPVFLRMARVALQAATEMIV